MKRLIVLLLGLVMFLSGVGAAQNVMDEFNPDILADGIYSAVFTTDSSMFRVNETLNNRGILTVSDGEMTIHVVLNSKKIVNLYPGLAVDAKQEGAELLQPVEEEVTYPDGWVETVYAFDVPVPVLDELFDLALIGTKGKWYDHKVSVSDPEPVNPEREIIQPAAFSFSGGSGRITITCNGIWMDGTQAMAEIVFSSPNYTHVTIDGREVLCQHDEHTSSAQIPVNLNATTVIRAETTAMSTPHEVEYTLYIGTGETAGLPGLVRTSGMELSYAEGFTVDYYEGGYALIDVKGSAQYLAVPEGMPVPDDLNPEIVVLQKPLTRIYLAATAAMSLFDSLDALDHIRMSSIRQEDWTVIHAAEAMERGDILFAGKYSEPDFELLLSEHCDLAIESMMISHTPRVKELIELLNIPVFIDRSSYEPHPLGRVEWVKLYGALLDKEAEAQKVFEQQVQAVAGETPVGEGKTVAYFALSPDGTVTVRGAKDYIARSIELAGGRYVFSVSEGQETNSSVSITMESFYDSAADADYIIYNAAIEEPVTSIELLLRMQPLFGDFKAVKEGNVWCAQRSLYQATDRIGDFIEDLKGMLAGNEDGMTFLFKVPETEPSGK